MGALAGGAGVEEGVLEFLVLAAGGAEAGAGAAGVDEGAGEEARAAAAPCVGGGGGALSVFLVSDVLLLFEDPTFSTI